MDRIEAEVLRATMTQYYGPHTAISMREGVNGWSVEINDLFSYHYPWQWLASLLTQQRMREIEESAIKAKAYR